MQKKIHITEDGPKLCIASVKDCKYSETSNHYESFAQAQAVYEAQKSSEIFSNTTLKKKKQKPVEDMSDQAEKSSVTIKEIREVADSLIDDPELEITNHSSFSDKEYITIEDLQDPDLAGNNCFAVTSIVEEVLHQDGIDNESIEIVMDDGTVHWANRIGNNVLDFSYRQFDENCDFPVIAKYDTWMKNFKKDVHKKYGINVAE